MTRKTRRFAIVGAAFGVAALSVALVLAGLRASVAYFYTPSDLAALPAPPTGPIRLGGLVAAGSVAYGEGEKASVTFTVEDEFSQLPVHFVGVLPDLFREGQGVVALGALRADGALEASQVLAKHDETYMPKEVADALKEQGRWRHAEDGAGPES